MFDLGIVNGQIYIDGRWFEGNIYVKDGRIEAVTKTHLEADEEYDARGRYVLPGFIDPHVHFDLTVGSYTSVDDFYSGSISAAYGGITTFLDFLDPVNSREGLKKAFEDRRRLAEKSVINYGFHATIMDLADDPLEFLNEAKALGIPTIKLFTTYAASGRRTFDRTIEKLLSLTKDTGTTLLVHAENDGIVIEGKEIPVAMHGEARPELSEISEVLKLAEMTRYCDGKMYIVHTNCGTTIERLKRNYNDILNRDFIIESCPHYFIFASDIYKSEKGCLYTMTPPLRNETERRKLNAYFDDVYTIGTDHCPFNGRDKVKPFVNQIPMGIGGVENSFPVMYKLFKDAIIDKYTKNPAMAHGIYPRKGNLLPGADADIVIFDPSEEYIVLGHHSNADYNPYEGVVAKGKVCSTISNGKFIIKEGQFIGGCGDYLKRGEYI